MKKVAFLIVAFLSAGILEAQDTLLCEGFDSGIPAGWTMYSDGITPASSLFSTDGWTWFNESLASFAGNPGGCIATTSFFSLVATADRWIVTPALNIPDTGYAFSLDCRAQQASYPDGFIVKVGTNAADKSSFATVHTQSATTDAYETYTVSLDAFAGQTVYVAVVNNNYNGNMLFADNFKVLKSDTASADTAAIAASFTDIAADYYVPKNIPLNVYAAVQGHSATPITSLKARFLVNGTDTTREMSIDSINIPNGQTRVVTLPDQLLFSATGHYGITILFYGPNGTDGIVEGSGIVATSTYVYDTADTVRRASVVEQFTSVKCGGAPVANEIVEAVAERHPGAILLAHHAGGVPGQLNNANSEALTWYFNNNGETFVPAVMIDRFSLSPFYPGPAMGISNDAELELMLGFCEKYPCFVSLDANGITYDSVSRRASGNVTGVFTAPVYGPNTRINVYVVEDSLRTEQLDTNNGSQQVLHDYLQNNTCRGALNGDWGASLAPTANGAFSHAVDYALPAGYNPKHVRLAAVVYNYDSTNALNSRVLNGTQTGYLVRSGNVGIHDAGAAEIALYPNPATNAVTISASESIRSLRLCNALGQTLYCNGHVNATALRLNTSDYPAGIYLLTVATDSGVSTRRVCISR